MAEGVGSSNRKQFLGISEAYRRGLPDEYERVRSGRETGRAWEE
jgi:hypothetical protein